MYTDNTISPVRFAVIGFGHIGRRHAAMIAARQDAVLVGVCDVREALRSSAEMDFNTPFFTDISELLAATTPDVVCICTPNGLHAQHALQAINANAHVVIEKPMGMNRAECEQLIFKALQQQKQVFCVMQNRYSPPAIWLQSVVQSGILGNLYSLSINCFWNRDDRYYAASDWKGSLALDGGPLLTQFSHFVDILYWIFGDITDIKAQFSCVSHAHNTEFEDTGTISFRLLRDSALGNLNYSTSVWDANLESSITLIAEHGSLKIGGQYMDKVEYCHIKNYTMPTVPAAAPPNDYGSYKGSAANHHFIFDNVLATLAGKTTATTNALEGMKVVEMIARIYAQRTF